MQALNTNIASIENTVLIALCNSIKEGAAVIETSTEQFIFCNRSWLNMFEVESVKEANLFHLSNLRRNKLTTADLDLRIRLADEKGFFSEQVEYISKNGHPFWADLSLRPFTIAANKYYFILIDPIGKVKEREKQIADDKHRFEALLEHASLGIIETNDRAEIINVNPYALQLFGYERNELINKKIEFLIPERFHDNHLNYRKNYLHHPRNRPMGVGLDLFAIRKDGTEFPVEVSLSNYHRDGKTYVIAFVNDITIRKETETRINKLNDDLEATVEQRTHELKNAIHALEESKQNLSRLLEKEKELGELKSRFVSIASHEFRTPLSTILSSAYLIEKYPLTDDQPKREKHLNRIFSSANILTDLLNDFLTLGKLEEGVLHVKPVEFDLQSFIISVIEDMTENLKKEQKIQYHHHGNISAYLDTSLLKHILFNLLSNASKYSPEGALIEVYTIVDTQLITLRVKDNGRGISAEDQQHLTERFFRGSNALNTQGTGLGLHIVSKYAELINGSVNWKSKLGEGTEFTLTFKILDTKKI